MLNDERFCISVCVRVRVRVRVRVCACVCLFVVFCHRMHLDTEIYVRTFSPQHGKLLYIIIVIFAENASFRSYGVICLPRMPLTTSEPQSKYMYVYQRNPRNVGMSLLFAISTKIASSGSYSTFVYLLRVQILNINMHEQSHL